MKKPFSSLSKIAAVSALLALLPQAGSAQSLWKENTSRPLVSDRRARAVGDIVTILVQESNTATKDNSTQTAKKSSVDASISSFLYGPGASSLLTKGGQYPAMKFSNQNDFTGGGKVNNSEKITAQMAVRVVDVLPNGNLVIEGSRQTHFAGETQDAVLRGVVRAEDVAANNTVYSYNIADATIKYLSKGSVSDSTKKGWFTRAWDKVSPF
jgi:flagellar L-ring protein precursor FlgH